MIDYIDDCFDLIKFPDNDFIQYQRNSFFDIDKLFCFRNPSKHTSKLKRNKRELENPYLNLFSSHTFWCIDIEDMRYDLEISLMFLLYFFSKKIPLTDNQIEDCYTKYDWTNKDCANDDRNPVNLEQYKKLFNTYLNFFTSSLVMFVNKIKLELVNLFKISEDIFKRKILDKIESEIPLSTEVNKKLELFIKDFNKFLYKSEFSKLRIMRNDFIHNTSPTKNKFLTTINKDLEYIELNFGKELATTKEIVECIRHSLSLVEKQSINFKDLIDDYFYYLRCI